jgi:hypothetical protein
VLARFIARRRDRPTRQRRASIAAPIDHLWWDMHLPGVGTNRYAYSDNDPINKSDPSGHSTGAGTGDGQGPDGTSGIGGTGIGSIGQDAITADNEALGTSPKATAKDGVKVASLFGTIVSWAGRVLGIGTKQTSKKAANEGAKSAAKPVGNKDAARIAEQPKLPKASEAKQKATNNNLARMHENAVQKARQTLHRDGRRSLEKVLKSVEARHCEHSEKLSALKSRNQFTSSVEREVRNFEIEIRAIQEVLGRVK